MAKNKWEIKLNDKVEDPYYELTNGQTTLIANCGFVGETDEDEDAIFKKVANTLNESGIDFHSANALELEQHIKIMELQNELESIKAELKPVWINAGKQIPFDHSSNFHWRFAHNKKPININLHIEIDSLIQEYGNTKSKYSLSDVEWLDETGVESNKSNEEKMKLALEKIIEMNRQQAFDQYGDAEKAETWSCVIVAREALKNK